VTGKQGIVRNKSRTKAADGQRIYLVDEAYRRLKAMILQNELLPGTQIIEQEAAVRLGMSRTPVREAMIRLQNGGLVQIVPRHGMRVLPISLADMREIYEVLIAVEPVAAELLARQRPEPQVIEPLHTACDEMEAALERDDLPRWAAADEHFHRSLLRLCGNRRLAQIGETVADQAQRVRVATLPLRPKPIRSTEDHRALLNAIARGDPDEARRVHYAHRVRGAAVMLGLLDRYRLNNL
jgi:DNA-binding GntR family transcriptional regulator